MYDMGDESLICFLLDRLAEDDQRADLLEALSPTAAEQARETVAAKRRIVHLGRSLRAGVPYWEMGDAEVLAWSALRLMAVDYADHPDFDAVEWRLWLSPS